MIKAYFEELIKKLEAEREKEVAPIKDRILREKVFPHNTEIDASRAKALSEIDAEYNVKIAELKKECEEKKQLLIKLGEEDKKANMESALATELAPFTVKYDKEIAKLQAQLAEIEE